MDVRASRESGRLLRREKGGDTLLDLLGGYERIGGIQDGPADNNVIGTVAECFLYIGCSLLIVRAALFHFLIIDWPYAWRHDQEAFSEMLPEQRRFQAGRDDAVAIELERTPGARKDQGLHITLKSQIAQIGPVETREYSDGENLRSIFLGDSRFQNFVVTVNGHKCGVPILELMDRFFNGFGNIEKLQIHEDLFSTIMQPLHEFKVAAMNNCNPSL